MGQQARGNYPLDDLSYDLITILHEKSKGLEAMDKYMRDAQGNAEICRLLEQIRDNDIKMIDQLKQSVARCLGGGNMGQGMTQGSPKGSVAGTNMKDSNRSGAV